MTEPDADRHPAWRIIFAGAAIYNIAFGAWAVFSPGDFFNWFDLGQPSHPWIWSCLGMVIGVYGLGYACAAWRPERGDIIVALGLLGKILGPIGWLWTVGHGEISPRMFPLILANDLIWWYPFGAYLLRHARHRRRIIAWIVAGFHVAACAALLSVREGTEVQADPAMRMSFILAHQGAWTLCWFLWTCASLGLLAFIITWMLRLREIGASSWSVFIGGVICAIGLGFDLTSEAWGIVHLTDSRASSDMFATEASWMTTLGAGIGNGLYCIGGAILSEISWRVKFQRGPMAMLAAGVWSFGFLLSVAGIGNRPGLMLFAGAALMALFIPWAFLTGLILDRGQPAVRA